MKKFVNGLSDIHFIAQVSATPAVFKEDEYCFAHIELCKNNNVGEDDPMVTTTIVNSDSGESLKEGIKVQIDGSVYTYTAMIGYIPLMLFPIDADSEVRMPVEITDESGNYIYAVCPITVHHHDAGRVDGKTAGQRIIEGMMYCN